MTRAESQAATRRELLDTARRVFVERGYHGASLELVAGEAGYTKGAVYSAFGSKGQMFLAVYEREVEERWSRIEDDVAAKVGSGEPYDYNDEATRDWFDRFRTEREWTLALLEFRLHAARDPELNADYAARHRRVVERLAGVIRMATGAGEARAAEVALAVIALSNGSVLEHLVLPDDATEERYRSAAGAIVNTFLRRS